MQRPALDPASTDRFAPVFEVQILRSEEGYTAVLQAGGRARQLSDQGSTCTELSEALALTLAILLDSEVPPARVPAPPVSTSTPVPRVPRPPPRPAPAPPGRRWDASLDMGAAQTVGFLTPFWPAFTANLSLRFRSWSIGLGALWLPTRGIDHAPGIVDFWLAAGSARGCVALRGELAGPRLWLCAEPMLGVIHGSGAGYVPDRDGTAPWFALGASALGEGPLVGPLGWSARATLVAPLTRQRFTVDRRTGTGADAPVSSDVVLESFPVGLLLGVGLRLTIP